MVFTIESLADSLADVTDPSTVLPDMLAVPAELAKRAGPSASASTALVPVVPGTAAAATTAAPFAADSC